jgi:hypothetical protein
MNDREKRNEFGLDEHNKTDVRKEGAKRYMPWILSVVAVLSVIGIAIYAMSDTGPQTASRAAVTTGASQTAPPPSR